MTRRYWPQDALISTTCSLRGDQSPGVHDIDCAVEIGYEVDGQPANDLDWAVTAIIFRGVDGDVRIDTEHPLFDVCESGFDHDRIEERLVESMEITWRDWRDDERRSYLGNLL